MADETLTPAQFVKGVRAALAIDVAFIRGELQAYMQQLAADARADFNHGTNDDGNSTSTQ